MYCGPLLINLNPGPNNIVDYLNLEKWLLQNTTFPETERKPHLYAFIDYIYESLVRENKDQSVNLLGQIGSGKTFNLVHILEYLCYFHAPEKKQSEFFDAMHKSMQLIHLLGSIFRENNIESSSCGMLLKIGFDEKNKICAFDMQASILDFTLPFSENGRSFSSLHALMTGAAPEIKRVLDLPERESSLNFFRKFTKRFDKNTKERFKLNDYEIWTRFHSLLNSFEFSKIEVIEILQLMAFVLLCNEASIGKKRMKHGEHYVLNKGHSSKKLSKNFCLNEEDFIKLFGVHKNIADLKNSLISLMKHTYYIIFEFVKGKIKSYLNKFFLPYKTKRASSVVNNNNISNNNNNNSFNNFNNINSNNNETKKIKYINFLDIPGEVCDETLGGLITNLANECQNLYAGTNYMSIVEKLTSEQLSMKYFQPLHSHAVVESLIGRDGLLTFLSLPFTEKNFKRLQRKVKTKDYYEKCCKFTEHFPSAHNQNSLYTEYDFSFDFKFSQKNSRFNYEALFLESKSVLLSSQILKLFEASGNSVIKSQVGALRQGPKNLLALALRALNGLFGPLEGLSPFVVYCLHSNNSLKLFFDNNDGNSNGNFNMVLNSSNVNNLSKNNFSKNNFNVNNNINKNEVVNTFNKYNFDAAEFEIPLKNTYEILRKSLAIPVLYWEWFGFHEWQDVELFVSEFSENFTKMQSHIYKFSKKEVHKDNGNPALRGNFSYLKGALAPLREMPKENFDLKTLNPFQAATYILSVLLAPRQYIIGSQHVLFRKNALAKARDLLVKVLEYQEKENLKMLMGGNINNNVKYGRRMSGKNMYLQSRNNSGLTSKIGIPAASNVSNGNLQAKHNKNSIFNRYNERKMSSIIGNAKNISDDNNNKKNNETLNNSRSKADAGIINNNNYSRSHSINETFNRQESLQTDANFGNFNNNNNKISNKNSKKNTNLNTEENNNINNNKKNAEQNNFLMRRQSMKIQCHLEIINKNNNNNNQDRNENNKFLLEAKNDLGLNLASEAKKVNFISAEGETPKINNSNINFQYGKYDLFNFLLNKKAEDLHNHSIENTHTTYLESEYEAYKKQNNVIIPKSKYFNALKTLFDPKSIESYAIFDYSEHLSEIRLLQNNWRAYKSRMLYKVFRYSCRMIVLMQKYIRGWVIRRKFRKFRLALRCIRKIQLFYRKRHQLRTFYATKIQSLLRMKMSRIYFMNKLALKEIGEDSDEEKQMELVANKQAEPEFIYETEYEYEEVEVEETDDEESENENENKNENLNDLKNKNDDDNNNNNEEGNYFNEDAGSDLNQNNVSFSVDNSNNISVNFGESRSAAASNISKKPPNPIRPIGNLKDKGAGLNLKLLENNRLNKIGAVIKDPNAIKANFSKNAALNNSKLNSSKISNNISTISNNNININNTSVNKEISNKNKTNTLDNNNKDKNYTNNNNTSITKNKNNKNTNNNNNPNTTTNPATNPNKVKTKKEVKPGEIKKKKKKKVMKLVKKRKLVPNPNAKTFEKQNQKRALDRAMHFADVISNGFTEKYLKRKYPKKHMEKELHDVSVSMVDRKKSMDQSSIIGRKWYFNNLSLIHELEVDKDKRQILDILIGTNAVKGLGKI